MGAVDFSIDPQLVDCLRSALPLSVFVETGTFEGEAIGRVLHAFDEIHSIELSDHLHGQAAARFAGEPRVTLHHGDSSEVLASLGPGLEGRGVLYWLDAHWCAADGTAGEESQCPLLGELEALGRLNDSSVVLVDDARLFLAPPPAPHDVSSWPRARQVLERLADLSSSHEIMVVNDVIVLFPERALPAVSECATAHAVDWLGVMQRVEALASRVDELERREPARLEQLRMLEQFDAELGSAPPVVSRRWVRMWVDAILGSRPGVGAGTSGEEAAS